MFSDETTEGIVVDEVYECFYLLEWRACWVWGMLLLDEMAFVLCFYTDDDKLVLGLGKLFWPLPTFPVTYGLNTFYCVIILVWVTFPVT